MMSNSSNSSNLIDDRGNSEDSIITANPKFRYCFTLNNYSDTEFSNIKNFCAECAKEYIVGEEIGENNTPHLQGYMSLKKKLRITSLHKIPGFERCHFEETKGSKEQNFKYCSKGGKYISFPSYTAPRQLNVSEPDYPWQRFVINTINTSPDDRSIYWIYDPVGNVGKTHLMKYLFLKKKCAFTTGGKKNDIMNLLLNYETELTTDNFCVIFDIPRETKPEHVSYTSLEMLKNGIVENHKFECKTFLCHTPHIFVFSNTLPVMSRMSLDRWKIYEINSSKELEAIAPEKLIINWEDESSCIGRD